MPKGRLRYAEGIGCTGLVVCCLCAAIATFVFLNLCTATRGYVCGRADLAFGVPYFAGLIAFAAVFEAIRRYARRRLNHSDHE